MSSFYGQKLRTVVVEPVSGLPDSTREMSRCQELVLADEQKWLVIGGLFLTGTCIIVNITWS